MSSSCVEVKVPVDVLTKVFSLPLFAGALGCGLVISVILVVLHAYTYLRPDERKVSSSSSSSSGSVVAVAVALSVTVAVAVVVVVVVAVAAAAAAVVVVVVVNQITKLFNRCFAYLNYASNVSAKLYYNSLCRYVSVSG